MPNPPKGSRIKWRLDNCTLLSHTPSFRRTPLGRFRRIFFEDVLCMLVQDFYQHENYEHNVVNPVATLSFKLTVPRPSRWISFEWRGINASSLMMTLLSSQERASLS